VEKISDSQNRTLYGVMTIFIVSSIFITCARGVGLGNPRSLLVRGSC
jgi:hypothetical protein